MNSKEEFEKALDELVVANFHLADYTERHNARKKVIELYDSAIAVAPVPSDPTEIETLRRDAARYRWLRSHRDVDGNIDDELHVHVDSSKCPDQWALIGPGLDRFIDDALAANKEKGT